MVRLHIPNTYDIINLSVISQPFDSVQLFNLLATWKDLAGRMWPSGGMFDVCLV